MFQLSCFVAIVTVLLFNGNNCLKLAKDNGDIYVVNEQAIKDSKLSTTTEVNAAQEQPINFEEVTHRCNSSFSIPMDYLLEFNNTGALPDIVDKTGMCHLRCFYEKSGLIEDWKLNADKIRDYMWPATGDSLEYCEKEGNEK